MTFKYVVGGGSGVGADTPPQATASQCTGEPETGGYAAAL